LTKTEDFISLTDIDRAFDGGGSHIESWLRNRNTVEFPGVWERVYNPDFNSVEFDGIFAQTGLNRFKLSVKRWVNTTGAVKQMDSLLQYERAQRLKSMEGGRVNPSSLKKKP